jgi:HAD superfamily hydrolase (TIGR01509 family)
MRGMIFDIDGTLIDTNPAHVRAWQAAFQRLGFEVPVERIEQEIGKGGDKLVPSVLGPEVEEHQGEALRRAQKEEFLAIAKREHFQLFPGAREIFPALRQRGIRTALATSSDDKHLDATMASAGVDLRRLADVTVTKSAGDASKPDPDLVVAALDELGLPPAQCAMVGDTVYDGQACQAAGVLFFGALSGPATEAELIEAGARAVWKDVADLLAQLNRALEIASVATAVE